MKFVKSQWRAVIRNWGQLGDDDDVRACFNDPFKDKVLTFFVHVGGKLN